MKYILNNYKGFFKMLLYNIKKVLSQQKQEFIKLKKYMKFAYKTY